MPLKQFNFNFIVYFLICSKDLSSNNSFMDLSTAAGSSIEFNKVTSVGNISSLPYNNNSKLEYPETEDLDVLIAHNTKK